jgi:shikimate kinase
MKQGQSIMRIFLAGVGCVGKTTIGKKLAEILKISFYDLDKEIEKYFNTSIERLQDKFLTTHSFREEASKALIHVLGLQGAKNCIIALPPSGLMGGYLRVVKKAGGITICINDTPENILKRVTFYDKESRQIFKELTAKEKKLCLSQIKNDISYFRPSYKKADLHIKINGLNADEAAMKIRDSLLSTGKGASVDDSTM